MQRMGGRSRFTAGRQAMLAGLVLAVLGFFAVIRVLPPAEVLTVTPVAASTPIPFTPGTVGQLYSAPLIVGNQYRIYAAPRQVRADTPANAKTERTPAWSFRRWPATVLGVVTAGDLVISRWSDGELVAIEAATGTVAWRAAGPKLADNAEPATQRRTGEGLVWTPTDLYTATVADGRALVLVRGGLVVDAYDAATGERVSAIDQPCGPGSFTTVSGDFACQAGPGLAVFDLGAANGALPMEWAAPSGTTELTPDSCTVGRSGCALVRAGGTAYRFTADGVLAAPLADDPNAEVMGDMVYTTDGVRDVTAHSLSTGKLVWKWPGRTWDEGMRVLAVQPGRVHLITKADRLITLDAATGGWLSMFKFAVPIMKDPAKERHWVPGTAYVSGGMLAVVRKKPTATEASADEDYYFQNEGIGLAVT